MPTGSEVAYFDASALHKLVILEPQSGALRQAARAWPRRVTSRLAVVELMRSVRRADVRRLPQAAEALRRVTLIAPSDRVLAVAMRIEPPDVRALDAIHLASALQVRPVLAAFVSYDRRQLDAATAVGLPVVSPV